MQKLTLKQIIEFAGKSEKSKQTFVNALKMEDVSSSDTGGHYWITSLSAVANAFKLNDLTPIQEKEQQLFEKYNSSDSERTRTMYQRNMTILKGYRTFDFESYRPTSDLIFQKKPRKNLLTIRSLDIQVSPSHVFSFKNGSRPQIGAIWFNARLVNFNKEELGMIVDALYRYLKVRFQKDYAVNPKYCIAVDIGSRLHASYSELESGTIRKLLTPTLKAIDKLL